MKHRLPSLVFTLFAVGICSLGYAQKPVFINEIHYDNEGTDTGESLEIAGPAGTDLSSWSIVLYNGNGGEVYNTTSLSGTIPNQQNGYGTVSVDYAVNGIQNGSPDGIALVNGTNVVQFLSYEGVFTAVRGPAEGLLSEDIGVVEGSNTTVGTSLQLTGSGSTYESFSWAASQPHTFGAVNNSQSFETISSDDAKIVINEIDYDQPGTDNAEFIELKNVGAAPINLDTIDLILINGTNNSIYNTINLPTVNLSPGAYFVISANVSTVPNTDLEAAPATNLIQNGAPDAVALIGISGNVLDVLSYEGEVPDYAEGTGNITDDGSEAEIGISRIPDGIDSDQNDQDFVLAAITPGEANATQQNNPEEPVAAFIHQLQGEGFSSPLIGQTVAIRGVVVGDFQQEDEDPFNTDLDGFYVQEETEDYDANEFTSEGIFVYAPGAIDVQIGDLVEVVGEVAEFSGLTELTNVSSIEIAGTAELPAPVEITLPTSEEQLESVEGMLVRFPQSLTISEYFNYDRFGEIVLALPLEDLDRPFQPTSYLQPGAEAAEVQQAIISRRITLDDGRSMQNPDPARHPNGEEFTLENLFRGGDLVKDATGILDYRFDVYRIQPTEAAEYTRTNPRTAHPEAVGGSLKVASFNVLNYFTTLGSRGADNANEFERQRTKIIAALTAIDADIVGLIEIENNTEAIENLVNGLNEAIGEETYEYVPTGTIGTDEIKVAFIYKTASVSPIGDYAVLTSEIDPRFIDTRNRPALAQTFQEISSQGMFTVSVNHFKSKGSGCGEGDDDPQQGNCNYTRTQAAEALVDWLATDPTDSGDPDFMIIGDLNAYDEEDPIDKILAGADDVLGTEDDYVDLVEEYQGEFAYSYVFDGQFGYLDYALVNTSLASQITGAAEWHINADEPDILDYDTSFKQDAQDALYETDPYRASDHDPVIVGLNLFSSICETEPQLPTAGNSKKPLSPKIIITPDHSTQSDLEYKIKIVSFSDIQELIVISKEPITAQPQDGHVYQASEVFGEGDAIEEGMFVIGKDNERNSSYTIDELEPATTYYVAVFIYHQTDVCAPNYLADPVAVKSFKTKKRKDHSPVHLKPNLLNVYPNPVRDWLYINVPSLEIQEVELFLNDMQGKPISLGKFDLVVGDNLLEVDINDLRLRRNLYLLSVASEKQQYPVIRISME